VTADSAGRAPATPIEALAESLQSAARHNPNDVVAPAAILWTDPDEQWLTLLPQLRALLPHLFTLGEYRPEERTGPAVWLRCIVDRSLPEPAMVNEAVPVVYLPGVSRQTLRAVEECPGGLKPLVELQYRGTCWMQRNGRDWTVEAFLVSRDALGLDVARDGETRRAMLEALAELAATPVDKLGDTHLEAADFHKLVTGGDTVRDLLSWLSDPERVRESWSSARWSAFRSSATKDYGFDPEKDGELTGAELLGKRHDAWANVWARFAESPVLYPGVPTLLRKAAPSHDDLFGDHSSWPQRNDALESQLRARLAALENATPAESRAAIVSLEEEHGPRREWVWAKLGQAPLAHALLHLRALAGRTETVPGGVTAADLAQAYASEGWKADAAVVAALAAVSSTQDVQAVRAAVRSLYLPWVADGAARLQEVLGGEPPKVEDGDGDVVSVDEGGVILFADGLRLDAGQQLAERMRARGWSVVLRPRWCGLPSVTATGKPAVSPIADRLEGDGPGEDFLPSVAGTGQTLSHGRFRKLLGEAGYQPLAADETGDPSGRAWTEFGDLDKLGHSLQAKLAARVDEQIGLLADRIRTRFEAGWREGRIVTDHGWLLVPGGLPKVDLPKYLTQSRWARCAAVKGGSTVDVPTVPWRWNPTAHVATAPGVACFVAGAEYAHGGISFQECLVPDMRVTPGEAAAPAVTIVEALWVGLRCRVRLDPLTPGVTVDLRRKVGDPASSVTKPRAPGEDGVASVLVADDALEGTPAAVVVLDAGGHVIAKHATIIGGSD